MRRTTFGRTGLEVSIMGLGGGGPSRLGRSSHKTQEESEAIVREAIAGGINVFDSSESYGTEAILGSVLTDVRRDEVVICTKIHGGVQGRPKTIVEVEDVVVAEIVLQVNRAPGAQNRLTAFLHRTIGGVGPGYHEVPGASITISRSDGFSVELARTTLDVCAATTPVDATGTCYAVAPSTADRFGPGDRLEARVVLQSGELIFGASQVPGDFSLQNVPDGGYCTLPAETPLEVRWSPSQNAWAYVNETLIEGLGAALALEGIEADDPLYLLGLSVSAADTSIVFPSEFGVFNRFELEQDLALRLQKGLPAGTTAQITITATDRNYVNWVRGGNFNPSGQVRLPSLRGDGTGVFSSVLVRTLSVQVDAEAAVDAPDCPTF